MPNKGAGIRSALEFEFGAGCVESAELSLTCRIADASLFAVGRHAVSRAPVSHPYVPCHGVACHCVAGATVSRHAVSVHVSMLRVDIEDLRGLVDVIDRHTAESTADPQAAVTVVLDALECIWGMRVPDGVNHYLRVRYFNLRHCLEEYELRV